MPEDMPEHMPEDMPDRMSDRMPEDMSDRMPEDLPVRKCINAMVGIIRSEVIVFLMMYFWSIALFSDTLTHVSFGGAANFYRNSSGFFRIKDIPKVYIHGIPIVFFQ